MSINVTATTEIYTLSLHDALPILAGNGKAKTEAAGSSTTHCFCLTESVKHIRQELGADTFPGIGDDELGFAVGICQFRSEEHTSELQSRGHLVCRLLLEKKKKQHV